MTPAARLPLLVVPGALTVAILTVIGWPAGAYLDFDFFPFYAAARMLLSGTDPYDANAFRAAFIAAGSQGHAFGGPFGYPLPAAILALPYALLPFAVAAPAWFVTQVALAAIGLDALGRRLFGARLRRDAPLLFVLVATMPATLQTFAIGNVGGFLLAIAAGALVLLLDRRPLLAGAVLGLGVFKPHVFLVLVPVVLIASGQRIRIAAGGALVSLALVLLSTAIRPSWIGEWIQSLGLLQEKGVAHANVWGPFAADAQWAGWLALFGLVATFAAWWWRARPEVAPLFGAAVTLSLLVAPYLWTHYYVMLGVPIAVVLAAAPGRGPRRAFVLIVLALATVVVPWVLYLDTYQTGAEPYGAIVPLALFALIVFSVRGTTRDTAPPETVAAAP